MAWGVPEHNAPEHNAWLREELPMPTNRKTTLIRKAARQFRVGEVLYLVGCDTGDLYGVLRGAFVITEVKHQSDTGVSFFLRHQFIDSDHPWSGPKRSYLVEFTRGQMLYRLAGTPLFRHRGDAVITEPEVRAALTYMQNLREQFPDFAYDDKPSQALLDRIDAYNMMIMREILEAADTAREHVIQETP